MIEYTEDSAEPVRIALIGSGIFIRDAHVPSILRQPAHLQIAGVYSRHLENATALAKSIPNAPYVTDELGRILEDQSVESVLVAVPISIMPKVVEQCLRAGKHVLSEKPIAPTVAGARRLLALAERCRGQVWMVGENWRFEDAFRLSAQMIQADRIGKPLLFHWSIHSPFGPANKYFSSDWRRQPAFPGGHILDGGVHHVAALRMLLGEVNRVSVFAAQPKDTATLADTLSATLEFEGGTIGAYTVTYAVPAAWPPVLHVTGERGTIRVQRREIDVEQDGKVERIDCDGFDGVEKELVAFAKAVQRKQFGYELAVEAARDLAVLEAMLESARSASVVKPAVISL